jgi:hypothetical protein
MGLEHDCSSIMPSNIATRSAIPPLTRRPDGGLVEGLIVPQFS